MSNDPKLTVADLINELSKHDPAMPIVVFTNGGDYGTPCLTVVTQRTKPKLLVILAEEDD